MHAQSFHEAVLSVSKRPGMYLYELNYGCAASFIDGMDYASDDKPLAGLKDWLYKRFRSRSARYWVAHLHDLIRTHSGEKSGEELDRAEVTMLFEILLEYLDSKQRC